MLARTLALSLAFLLLAGVLRAAEPEADPRAIIAKQFPGTRVEDIRPTPIAGIYELTHGADIAYVTGDGKFAFSGDLINVANNDNLTEAHRRDVRTKLIDAIPESEMLVFGPRDPKYT